MTTSKTCKNSGSISTFPAGKGYVRIDACVPGAIGHAMTQLAFASGQVDPRLVKDLLVTQHEVGGNMLLDVTASAPLAALILAVAKRNGATVPACRAT